MGWATAHVKINLFLIHTVGREARATGERDQFSNQTHTKHTLHVTKTPLSPSFPLIIQIIFCFCSSTCVLYIGHVDMFVCVTVVCYCMPMAEMVHQNSNLFVCMRVSLSVFYSVKTGLKPNNQYSRV